MMSDRHLTPNAALALRGVAYASARDLEGFRQVCAPDVVLDYPFHADGAQRHVGVQEMIAQFSVIQIFETFRIDVVDLFDCGETVIVEGRSHGTCRNGRPPYENHYLFVLRCRDGRIVEWREFYNPLEVLKQTRSRRPVEGATLGASQ